MAAGMAISSNPRTGLPVRNSCQAVSVIAPNCVMAGILSTTGFILGAEEGLELIREQRNAEACITTEYARHQTRRFSSYVPHNKSIPRAVLAALLTDDASGRMLGRL